MQDTKISARLSKQGAMLEELRALLPVVAPATARADMRHAIVDENILLRPSLASRIEIFKKLSMRYFRANAPSTVERFIRALQTNSDPNQLGLLAYTMLLWNDALVFTLGTQWLAPKLNGPTITVETSDIEAELKYLSKEFPVIRAWKPVTCASVASHYLGVLRDTGYASGIARKTLRRPFIGAETILFGTQLLVASGEPTARVPEHALFTAMGLTVADVVEALSELRRAGRIDFAIQGDVVHLNAALQGLAE